MRIAQEGQAFQSELLGTQRHYSFHPVWPRGIGTYDMIQARNEFWETVTASECV